MPENLDAIFKPRSIAVVGTSRKDGTIGREILYNLVAYGFNGPVYPVNPKAAYVNSIKCYPSISAIPDKVDLAIIVIPKEQVLSVVEECGEKGVKGIVVISAGFKEIGEKGIQLEKELVRMIKKYGIRLVGPNCMGVINTAKDIRMDATFGSTLPLDGQVGFMSQSGALGNIILEYADELKIGFSKFVSMGNKADVSGNDLLMDFEDDENTKIILMYLESFGNPRKFTKIARRLTKKKPIIAVKAGRTLAGARAASSHTGALAGLDVAVDALFEQCGVLRATSIEELFDYAVAFSNQPLPKGKKVAIVTNAGGPGIIATDACVSLGLKMSTFDKETYKKLEEILPEEASTQNPVDILGDGGPKRYEKALDVVLKDINVDSVITIFVPPLMSKALDVAVAISKVSANYDKPVLGCFMGREEVLTSIQELEKNNIPAYLFPESAAKSIAGMYKYRELSKRSEGNIVHFEVEKKKVKSIIDNALSAGKGYLSQDEVRGILEAYGFKYPETQLVKNEEEAVNSANRIGFPVVLKIASLDIIHKSDAGGVVIDLEDEGDLRAAFKKVISNVKSNAPEAKIDGVMVQKMVKGGRETILGMSLDASFGPLIMFGLGGIYVEVLKDVSFRIAPITDLDASDMVKSVKSYPLLKGVRGEKPVDIEEIEKYIQRLSRLVEDFPEIEEMDINPFVVFEKGRCCNVVDARIKIERSYKQNKF
ncbi:MAG: acetate--CoA ligase family protein [Methanomassiliicoccales archaeon]|nr:MAG: acetate--CoA ligase family protein [Methanomassiliicoccales archaeon]